jgi:hypothetical protein
MSKISLELDVPEEIKEIFTKSNRYSLIWYHTWLQVGNMIS